MKFLIVLLLSIGPIAKAGEGFIVTKEIPEAGMNQPSHHPEEQALACFYNVTERPIRILWRYGYSYWNEYTVPGDKNLVTLLYYRTYDHYWPLLTIRFDSSTSGATHWVDRSIAQYIAPELDCSRYGKRYVFSWNRTNPEYVDHFMCKDNVCNLGE